jgi:hypothetical protein
VHKHGPVVDFDLQVLVITLGLERLNGVLHTAFNSANSKVRCKAAINLGSSVKLGLRWSPCNSFVTWAPQSPSPQLNSATLSLSVSCQRRSLESGRPSPGWLPIGESLKHVFATTYTIEGG